jgi:stage II sporulation protein D
VVRKLFFLLFFLLIAARLEASTIKVLILDDLFQTLPQKDEKIERMGKMSGDLLINGTHYAGDIEVWRGKSGMYLIDELPLEEYIENVVNSEVGSNWDMEALKAQAVIARTYALYQKASNNRNPGYDLTSSVLHQVYKGNTVDARVAYAVMQTKGEVLTYDGQLIEAFYHSTSSGSTEEPAEVFGKSYPYLRAVPVECGASPYCLWERRIPVTEMEKALDITGFKEMKIASFTATKRVKTVGIVCAGGVLTFKATDLRKMLGWNRLPSTSFTVTRDEDTLVFEGQGYGHGVGLCQWSALQMAQEGKSYRQILSYFYPGTTLQDYEGR